MRNPFELMEMFGVNIRNQGALDFGELCQRLALDMQRGGRYAYSMSDTVICMMKDKRVSRRLLYARMKQSIEPLLDAEPDTLWALGIRPPRKPMTTDLAVSVAQWIIEE